MSSAPRSLTSDLDQSTFSAIDEFRKQKSTSVLTVMFTDIEGFTKMTEARGDEYSNKMRSHHDSILVSSIEDNNGGKVIKHIGDAVMAVFAEPSVAVERALKIQRALKTFNQANSELDDINVRIGLHMGQVTTEKEASIDVFGRHVNRTSRVEGLAAGGHILMSFPVYDSAKGSVQYDGNTTWTHHGAYFVKGVDKPLDIYEVSDPEVTSPKAPRGANKKKSMPKAIPALILVLIGIAIAYGINAAKAIEIALITNASGAITVNHKEELVLEAADKEGQQIVANTLSVGRHVLHFDSGSSKRHYAVIDVKRGKNVFEPKFEAFSLPEFKRVVSYKDEPTKKQFVENNEYQLMVDGMVKKHKLNYTIDVSITEAGEDQLNFLMDYAIKRDGAVVKKGTAKEGPRSANASKAATRSIMIYSDETHEYTLEYSMKRNHFNVYLKGRYR